MNSPDYSPTHPNRKPQGGVNAYWIDHGRVWVESIHGGDGTALIRPDAGEGTRGRACKVRLADIDFTREWKFR